MTTNIELTKIIDDFGITVYSKEIWSIEYNITKLNDGRFQAFFINGCGDIHENIEDAIRDIEDHIEANK